MTNEQRVLLASFKRHWGYGYMDFSFSYDSDYEDQEHLARCLEAVVKEAR